MSSEKQRKRLFNFVAIICAKIFLYLDGLMKFSCCIFTNLGLVRNLKPKFTT